jgi:hypothetical protein
MGLATGKTRLSEVGNNLCNAPLGSVTTQGNTLTLPAQAIWQNRSQILMPEAVTETTHVWRLLSSTHGQLQVRVGQSPRGADQAFRLTVRANQILEMPTLSDVVHRKLHTTQLVLVQEDGSGQVVKATRLQSAKALDDLFGSAALEQQLGATLKRASRKSKQLETDVENIKKDLDMIKDLLIQLVSNKT